MTPYETDRVLLRRVARLRRHWRWVLFGSLLCGLTAFIISLFQAKIYRATTYVLVSESKIGPVLPSSSWQYPFLPTFVPFVDNDALVAKAIEHFHLNQPPYRLTPHKFRSDDYLDVQIPKSTRLLEIRVEFPDAHLAADIANYLAQTAVEYNNQMNSTDTVATEKFLKQRMDQSAAHLAEAETKRLQVEEKARIADKEKELSILLNQKEQISSELGQLNMALAQNQGRAQTLQQALKSEPQVIRLKKDVTTDRFLEHAVEKMKLDKGGVLNATEDTLNTTREALQKEYVDSKASAAAEQAGVQTATARLGQINAQLNSLMGKVTRGHIEIDKAERDFALARKDFEKASLDYRNAPLTVNEKSQDLKQFAPALIPEKPVRPRILLNTLLACVLGLVLLSGIAITLDNLREIELRTAPLVAEDEPVETHRS